MGCDIHVHAERRDGDKWVAIELPMLEHKIGDYGYREEPFGERQYGKFGLLAGVRNYSEITPISEPRGLPPDLSDTVRKDYEGWDLNAHSASWLTVAELEAYDYDQQVEDRRCMRNGNGGSTCDPGEGKRMTLREFLDGTDFFESLEALRKAGAERVVFWFDN